MHLGGRGVRWIQIWEIKKATFEKSRKLTVVSFLAHGPQTQKKPSRMQCMHLCMVHSLQCIACSCLLFNELHLWEGGRMCHEMSRCIEVAGQVKAQLNVFQSKYMSNINIGVMIYDLSRRTVLVAWAKSKTWAVLEEPRCWRITVDKQTDLPGWWQRWHLEMKKTSVVEKSELILALTLNFWNAIKEENDLQKKMMMIKKWG